MPISPESLPPLEAKNLPAIVILGTGGTIAAAAASAANTTDYALAHGVEAVIQAVPQVHSIAGRVPR